MKSILLRAGDAALSVRPDVGGAIESWTWCDRPVLRPADAEDRHSGVARRLGAFALIPFAGRVRDGRFRWGGEEYHLPRNFEAEPHSIHGNAWQRAWTVAAQGDDRVTLVLEHEGGPAWPFAYQAEQRILLRPEGMEVHLSITNRHDTPAPAGLGLHPFFPRGAAAALGFQAGGVWAKDADGMPASLGPVGDEFRFDPARKLGATPLDDCYAGWKGEAVLDLPGLRLRMQADPVFGRLVVFTPPGKPFFCVEPLTHTPNDLNRADGAMHTLPPGGSLSGAVYLRLEPNTPSP